MKLLSLTFAFLAAAPLLALPADVSKLIQEDKYAEALARVEELLKATPQDAELVKLRSELQATLGPATQTATTPAGSATSGPVSPELRKLLEEEKYPEALELVEKLLKASPKDARLLRLAELLDEFYGVDPGDTAVLAAWAVKDELGHLAEGKTVPSLVPLPDNLDDQVANGELLEALAQVANLYKSHPHDSRLGLLQELIKSLPLGAGAQLSFIQTQVRDHIAKIIQEEQERMAKTNPVPPPSPGGAGTEVKKAEANATKPSVNPASPNTASEIPLALKVSLKALDISYAEFKAATTPSERQLAANRLLAASQKLTADAPGQLAGWKYLTLAAVAAEKPTEAFKGATELKKRFKEDELDELCIEALAEIQRRGWDDPDAEKKIIKERKMKWVGTWQASVSTDFAFDRPSYRTMHITGKTSRSYVLKIESLDPPKIQITDTKRDSQEANDSKGFINSIKSSDTLNIPGTWFYEENHMDYTRKNNYSKDSWGRFEIKNVEFKRDGKLLVVAILVHETDGSIRNENRMFYLSDSGVVLGVDAEVKDKDYSVEEINELTSRNTIDSQQNRPPQLRFYHLKKSP